MLREVLEILDRVPGFDWKLCLPKFSQNDHYVTDVERSIRNLRQVTWFIITKYGLFRIDTVVPV